MAHPLPGATSTIPSPYDPVLQEASEVRETITVTDEKLTGPDRGMPGLARIVRVIGETPRTYRGRKYWNCNIVQFEGREYIVSHRAILTVVTTAVCNAGCDFCSNEITFTPGRSLKAGDPRLDRVRRFALGAGVTKIAFTGGEPTLNPLRLVELAGELGPGFKRMRLHTNGWGLLKPYDGEDGAPLIDELIGLGLSGVSISVAHHDQELNREVMKLPANWSGMSDDALRQVAVRAVGGFQPRLSCVLTHDGVWSVSDMMNYIAWGRDLGFRRFIFRACSGIPEEYEKRTETSYFNRENHIDLELLSADFARVSGATCTFSERKSDSKVDVYDFDGLTIDVDASGEEEDPDPKIRRLNLMPDGVLYTSWVDPRSFLFQSDRSRALLSVRQEFGPVSEVC